MLARRELQSVRTCSLAACVGQAVVGVGRHHPYRVAPGEDIEVDVQRGFDAAVGDKGLGAEQPFFFEIPNAIATRWWTSGLALRRSASASTVALPEALSVAPSPLLTWSECAPSRSSGAALSPATSARMLVPCWPSISNGLLRHLMPSVSRRLAIALRRPAVASASAIAPTSASQLLAAGELGAAASWAGCAQAGRARMQATRTGRRWGRMAGRMLDEPAVCNKRARWRIGFGGGGCTRLSCPLASAARSFNQGRIERWVFGFSSWTTTRWYARACA